MSSPFVLPTIPPIDTNAAAAARERQNRLTKPTGSLGRLEDLTVQIAGITGNAIPTIEPPVIFVYAADHGVAARGVSAYPAEVTAQMVLNFVRGGAVINTLAAQSNAKLIVVDAGVTSDFAANLPIGHYKVKHGTADWTLGPAMTTDEAHQALAVGQTVFQGAGPVGVALIGEMGIGNTTTAAALTSVLLGIDPDRLIGPGTGVDSEGLARKLTVIEAGLARHQELTKPLDILAALGGLEIAAMAGTMLEAASHRLPILLDGFIATTAALVAVRLAPEIKPYLIAAHQSPEPGHAVQLEYLGLEPLLNLGMRLGEASGAAMALPLLRLALAVLRDVATYGEAGVSDRDTAA